ncbi:splicing factor 3b subunit 3 [Anaeramoeba flamelloides]|uniref:Splicing factor 3b subunit 3 n=1 Tax=Anaeramoeba flamelloides TaxID=1746091 RepID=A0ABQ8YLR4_9EUKA|nr:splicing factor 3b subunit 3 [Anaeramoeba flamelloides]
MYLYHLTLQKATGITSAVCGNFSSEQDQDLVVSHGKTLEIMRINNEGHLKSFGGIEVFGFVRSMVTFRLPGNTKDLLFVGTDSGAITLLEFNKDRSTFTSVHEEHFGKSGCRRIVPGEYLASDPKGRAVMIASVERARLVYTLSRDSGTGSVIISSPLEAHKPRTILFDVIGVDVGFENPIFACLESDYSKQQFEQNLDKPQKELAFYELDLGLNHVIRKWAEDVDPMANMLIAVPGGKSGPGGVLVCSEGTITFMNEEHDEIVAKIPRRENQSKSEKEKDVFVISSTLHKQKDSFFFLIQTEYGDVFKLTIDYEDDEVNKLNITYFDTLSVSVSMCIFKKGFLFVASESGNHYLYQIQSLGDEEDEEDESALIDIKKEENEKEKEENKIKQLLFKPHLLKNLLQIDEIENLAPLMNSKFIDLNREGIPQLLCLSGKANNSTFRILRHGLSVSEIAISDIPSKGMKIWTLRSSTETDYDRFIIISLKTSTMVLEIGEMVSQIEDKRIKGDVSTLDLIMMENDSVIQIHENGIRQTKKNRKPRNWKTPNNKRITQTAVNERQVAISLEGGDIIYFELQQDGNLRDMDTINLEEEIVCLDIAPITGNRLRSSHLAVGTAETSSIRILSLNPGDSLKQLSLQALIATPFSVRIIETNLNTTIKAFDNDDEDDDDDDEENEKEKEKSTINSSSGSLFLNIGLENGIYIRSALNKITGEISDTRTRYLGIQPVKLIRILVAQKQAILALSERCWLCYHFQGHFNETPISYFPLTHASSFCSAHCEEGIVGVSGNLLRIFYIERYGKNFSETTTNLNFTPRKMAIHPITGYTVLIERDYNQISLSETEKILSTLNFDQNSGEKIQNLEEVAMEIEGEDEQNEEEDEDEDEDEEDDEEDEEERGFLIAKYKKEYVRSFKPNKQQWSSCIRVYNALSGETIHLLELEPKEVAFSICICTFDKVKNEIFVVVGVGINPQLNTRKNEGGSIHLYRMIENKKLELVHKTAVPDIPYAIKGYHGKLLVGFGKTLRLYDHGIKKLLRKCENVNFPNFITQIEYQGNRIYVGDLIEGIIIVKYISDQNQFEILADETLPHYLTNFEVLDHNKIVGSDKFGQMWISKAPKEMKNTKEVDQNKLTIRKEYLNTSINNLETVANFHVGEMIISLQKITLGKTECLFYTTILGTIGVFMPFSSREDVDFFSQLEMQLREECPSLCGNRHIKWRSFYVPVKSVIDGDFCEKFGEMNMKKQEKVASALDSQINEILKRLEEFRKSIF